MAETRKEKSTDLWLLVLYVLMVVAGLALLGIGVYRVANHLGDLTLVGVGVLTVIVPAALYPIASAQVSARAAQDRANQRSLELLQTLDDHMLISDTAKRITHRERDRAALREAIRSDINKGDHEAALVLVTEMSQVYGYRHEAEEFRDQILAARRADVDQQVTDGIATLDQIIARHDWDQALAETGKLVRLFPDSPRVRGLDKRVKEAREQHKHELERKFLEAAGRDDIETAIDTLKELDKYLTESEAEPFRETARGVIGKKRDNLGVQFKLAVSDKEWTQAVRIGQQIIRDFPNTKMADEVRSCLDLLRERAAGEQATRVHDLRV
jgi:hypothetical protein